VGLQAVSNVVHTNAASGGAKTLYSDPQGQKAVIDEASKPAALVRFTFLESLSKLVAAEKPDQGAIGGATTPPAQP
jgi:hypothetical protein